MNYVDLIKDAFWITLRNRYLWFFGFFASGLGGGGGGWGGGGSNFDGEGQRQASADPLFAAQQTAFDNFALIAVLVLLGLLLVLAFIFLNLISQGALAESVAALERGESRRFASAWRAGISNLWPVLGQILLFILIGAGFLLLIGIPVAALILGTLAVTDSTGPRVLVIVVVALIAVVLLIAVFVSLAVIAQFALRELVVSGERVFDSIRGGYRLFRRNLGRSLLIWLIQVVLMFAAGIALLIALIVLGLVLFVPAIILVVGEYVTAAIFAGVVAALILAPILLVALGILGTFNHSYWTLAYLRLTTPLERSIPQQG